MKKKTLLLMIVFSLIFSTAFAAEDTISGHISGDVLPGHTVFLYLLLCGANDLIDTTETDSDGNFEFATLYDDLHAEDHYKVEAEARDAGGTTSYEGDPPVITFLGSLVEFQIFDFTLNELHTISGTVTGSYPGAVVSGLLIRLKGQNVDRDGETTTASDGTYMVSVPSRAANPFEHFVVVSGGDKSGIDFILY